MSNQFSKVLRRDLRRREREIARLRRQGFDTRVAEDMHERLRRLLEECVRPKGQ